MKTHVDFSFAEKTIVSYWRNRKQTYGKCETCRSLIFFRTMQNDSPYGPEHLYMFFNHLKKASFNENNHA